MILSISEQKYNIQVRVHWEEKHEGKSTYEGEVMTHLR